MKRSEIVIALANVASQGRYTVGIADAQKMTALFQEVAGVINSLESEEKDSSVIEAAPQSGGVRDVVEAEFNERRSD